MFRSVIQIRCVRTKCRQSPGDKDLASLAQEKLIQEEIGSGSVINLVGFVAGKEGPPPA